MKKCILFERLDLSIERFNKTKKNILESLVLFNCNLLWSFVIYVLT